MSRTNIDEQFQFLLSCIKHSNNGKIDFEGVAKECNIISKGATAKRYERMMKAHGINPNGGPSVQRTSLDTETLRPKIGTPARSNGQGNGREEDETKKKRKASSSVSFTKRAKIKTGVLASAERVAEHRVRKDGRSPGKETASATSTLLENPDSLNHSQSV